MESSQSERAFRAMEFELDALLSADEREIEAMGVGSTDRSVRSYHYKEHYLQWSLWFEYQRSAGLYIQLVTISLSYGESIALDESPSIRASRRAEIFLQGQISSVDAKFESSYSIDEIRASGFAEIVRANLKASIAVLDATVRAYPGPGC